MDAEKLLRILNDLQEDEERLNIKGKIDEIRNDLAQNNQAGFDSAKTKFADFINEIQENSISQTFSRTESLALKQISGEEYFGNGLIAQLEKIFSTPGFELPSKINEYRSGRNSFLEKVQGLRASLEKIGIEEYRPESYEIGIVIPEEEADFDKIIRRIKDFKLLIAGLIEAADFDLKGVKITRLNNGSLEFFSLQPAEVAVLLTTLLLNVSTIWDKITKYRKKIEETENTDLLTPESKKEMIEIWNRESGKMKNAILEELPERILKEFKKIEDGRKNEIRNQIKIGIKTIFAWLEVGIEIDITPVRVDSSENMTKKEITQIKSVQQTNATLREIYKLPKELKKLPFKLPDISIPEGETPIGKRKGKRKAQK